MNARRIASLAGTAAVTLIAAAASYDHMRLLASAAGQPGPLAALEPLSVDGLILVATVALGDGRRSKWSAWLAFVLGVAASLAANVLATPGGPVARVVSAWPAVALLLTVEVLARSAPANVATATPASVAAVATVGTADVAAPASVATVTGPALVAAPAVAAPAARPAVATVAAPAVAAKLTGTAAKVAAIVADRPTATAADVAAEVGVAERTARRHLAAARTALAAA